MAQQLDPLEAERLDLSYRTGVKLTPEQLRLALLREWALSAYQTKKGTK